MKKKKKQVLVLVVVVIDFNEPHHEKTGFSPI